MPEQRIDKLVNKWFLNRWKINTKDVNRSGYNCDFRECDILLDHFVSFYREFIFGELKDTTFHLWLCLKTVEVRRTDCYTAKI